ncbi:MAG: hypothetical protein LBU22_13080 [Dysgonamonadaceae bacterium]|jgi:hypothetical protein|nr:hypothetical protein [Dysgonamonadaceae bacterium]
MKTMILNVILIFSISCLWVQFDSSQLSTKQKVKDFEFLCQILEDNYPYLDMGRQQTNKDWASKKGEYFEKIKATPNDSTYLIALASILNDIGGGHLNMIPTFNHELYVNTYKEGAIKKPIYNKWVEILENPHERSVYWSKFYMRPNNKVASEHSIQPNYRDSLLIEDKIGIMRINSFLFSNAKQDSIQMTPFLKTIQNFDYLVIDIQGNGGGSDNYWRNYIVGRLTQNPISYPKYQIVKGGALNRSLYPKVFENFEIAKKDSRLPNLPEELIENGYMNMSKSNDTIVTNNPITFKGKIFLLVDEGVFSASEGLAYFCKASKWATIAGVRTGGDGACAEPAVFMLPESGILLAYPAVAGLNHDGNLNYKERTVPDIQIDGKNSNERLDNLIKYIREKY